MAQYKEALHLAGWEKAWLGTIGDETHLTAEIPQDHTPFSATGWPDAHPYPTVLALDVMHHPQAGCDVGPLVDYWVAEARAGETPWVKYIIWRAQRFDVRDGWKPVEAKGHFDHAHVSFRTDYFNVSIGDWSVAKKGHPVTTSQTGKDCWEYTIESESLDYEGPAREWLKYTVQTDRKVDTLIAQIATLSSAVESILHRTASPIDPQALVDALAANPILIDALASRVVDQIGRIPTTEEVAEALSHMSFRVTAA